MKVLRMDHVGINVIDLEAAKTFFLDLGLEVEGEGVVEGEWVGPIIGLGNVKSDIIMMRMPDGGTNIELIRFHYPLDEQGIQPSSSNTLGIRHITFQVEDIEGLVDKLKSKGTQPLGELYNYQDVYKLCYVRGPEGIIVELAEKLS